MRYQSVCGLLNVRSDKDVAEIIARAIGEPYHENYVRHHRVKAEKKIREALANDPLIKAMLADGDLGRLIGGAR